jgi:hypothetical protein
VTTALRLLVTLALLCAPFVLFTAATARRKPDNMILLMFPVVYGIPTAAVALLVLAPVEAVLDARGAGRLKPVVVPVAGAAVVLLVFGAAWWSGRRRRERLRAKSGEATRRRGELLAVVAGGVLGALLGALWLASAWVVRALLPGRA